MKRPFLITGKLIVTKVPHTGDLLPQTADAKKDQCSVPQRNLYCFRAGNVNPILV